MCLYLYEICSNHIKQCDQVSGCSCAEVPRKQKELLPPVPFDTKKLPRGGWSDARSRTLKENAAASSLTTLLLEKFSPCAARLTDSALCLCCCVIQRDLTLTILRSMQSSPTLDRFVNPARNRAGGKNQNENCTNCGTSLALPLNVSFYLSFPLSLYSSVWFPFLLLPLH